MPIDTTDGVADVLDAEAGRYHERRALTLGWSTCPVCDRPFHDHSADEAVDCMDSFASVEEAWPLAA